MFTVPVGMPYWGLGEHEPLIVDLFVPIVSCRNWKVTWTIRGIECGGGTVKAFKLGGKKELDQPVPVQIYGKL